MVRVSRKNRACRLHRLALAAIGLVTLNCASPALGDNVTVDVSGSGGGLEIIPAATEGMTANWNISDGDTISGDAGANGLVFSDGGPGSGPTTLNLVGKGDYFIDEGGITNNNESFDSHINITTGDSKLIVNSGNIKGNEVTTLIISSNDSTFGATTSDVTGNVAFKGAGDGNSTFLVGSIGDTPGVKTKVETGGTGMVNLKVSGGLGFGVETELVLGGATTAVVEGDIGNDTDDKNKITLSADSSLNVSGKAQGSLTVVNSGGSFNLAEMGTGVLNVGRGSAADDTVSVLIGKITGGAQLEIGGAGDYSGQAEVNAANIEHDSGDPADPTMITLKNAILKITGSDPDTDATYSIGGWAAGSFKMDTSDGEGDSHLLADAGDTLIFNEGSAPTVTVGAGGDVIVESDHLKYNAVLKSSGDGATVPAAGEVYFDEAVDFTDPNNTGNKMIFKSTKNNATNIFQQGVQITAGNWEFQGSTTFVAEPESAPGTNDNTLEGSQIYFTGSYDVDSTDPDSTAVYTIDGGTDSLPIDAAGSTLHLNKKINITYAPGSGGSLENLPAVMLGDMAASSVAFGADTKLSAGEIIIGKAPAFRRHGFHLHCGGQPSDRPGRRRHHGPAGRFRHPV